MEELTTRSAADLLGVSHPIVIKEIDRGRLPERKVGRRRGILFEHLVAHRMLVEAEQRRALEEASALDQDLGED